MHLKTLTAFLGFLAYVGQASPTPEDATIESPSLEERSTGVWLDVFHEGNCNSGWEDQPKSGWVWAGQCKNFDSFTYGARLGAVSPEDYGWPSSCRLKFWENADCHGRATVHNVEDTGKMVNGYGGAPYWKYHCFATANKASGEFYLNNGAASVLMTC